MTIQWVDEILCLQEKLEGLPRNKFFISTGGIMGLRPTQGDEKRLLSEAALHESAALPFVISTEAQRSGEISVLTAPSWKCFSTERSAVERPAVLLLRLAAAKLTTISNTREKPYPAHYGSEQTLP